MWRCTHIIAALVLSIWTQVVFGAKRKTLEGEEHLHFSSVDVKYLRFLIGNVVCSHEVDENSPFVHLDLENLNGCAKCNFSHSKTIFVGEQANDCVHIGTRYGTKRSNANVLLFPRR
jgi:hypothetical protein